MKGSGYMNETLKDGTIDLLLDGVKKKIDSVKENFKWKRLFVDTGDFFINNPDMLREFENDLYSVFSEDNLYRLAQKLKNKRGYEFPQLLYKELHDLMICNEIPEREAETYSYHFVQVIINYLEDNDQEKTMEIFLGEMRRENEGNFTELKSTLEAVVEKINALGNEEVKVYSIADIDVEIKKKSKYKRMGLDFFELDDEQFESKFQNVIENDLIYVVGKSREETTFRILNELRSKKLESKTLIIKSEEEWDKLQKTSITGNILIPFFYIYIFSSKREFSLLRPKPYERNGSEDYYKINQTLREKEIETKIKEFKEQNYALEDLIRIAVKQKKDMVGEVLARFYCEGVYDSKTFNLLLRLDEEGKYVYDYVACLYRQGSINLSEIVELVKKSCDNKNLLINLISLETIEDERKALISKESEEIKRDYWNKILRVGISNKAEHRVYIWALEECKKYGSLNTYLELLYDVRNKILMQELFDNIFAIEELKNNNSCGMETYYLREILKDLQSVFIMDDEKCVRLANLEWLCRNVLEWDEMKCLQRVMKTDSAFYAELVKILFKGEENEPDDEEKRNLASKVYDGFYKAKFCPTEQDGKVVYEDIRKWIDDFKERLIEQKQERLFGNLIGHLLAYAPIGEDGYSPCEAVRKIIEENPLDTLKNAYVIEEENKRGVHTADAGKSELILSDRYKKNAEGLQEHYPQTAEIYFTLSDNYKREAAYERKRAEDEW